MPEQVTRLRVFISSPSNLDAERAVVTKVIESLSAEMSEDRLVEFKVFDWKNDVVPGINADVQSVVSSQLNYDIYVGLLGVVFGSPTPRAGSGTEEEFNDAYARFRADPRSVRVLFYFNLKSDRVFDIDPEDLRRVIEFRKSLGPKGVLYQDFADLDRLSEVVRSHFRTLIRNQWDGNSWRNIESPVHTETKMEPVSLALPPEGADDLDLTSEEEKEGILEIIIAGHTAADELKEHLQVMTVASGAFAEVTISRTQQMQEATAQGDPQQSKALVDLFADDMKSFQLTMRAELPKYQVASSKILATFREITRMFFDERTGSIEQIQALSEQFSVLVQTTRGNRDILQSFKGTVEAAPSLTREFRAARKHLASVLDDFVSSYTVFISSSEELLSDVKRRVALVAESAHSSQTDDATQLQYS